MPELLDTACPECGGELSVAAGDAGGLVECPTCGHRFTPRPAPPADDGAALVRFARADLKVPGIGLIAMGFVHVLGGLGLSTVGVNQLLNDAYWQAALCFVGGVVSQTTAVVIVLGGRRMLQVRAYRFCLTAAWLAISPLTIWFWCAWIPGALFGVNALVVLLRKDVRRAFALNQPPPDHDPDAG